MRDKTARRHILSLILLFFSPTLVFAGVGFKDLGLLVSWDNIYYKVKSVEESREPGFLAFSVESAHAQYKPEGVLAMIKLLHEIEVIEKIRRDEEGSGFFDGAAASLESTKDGFVKLVSHPVESGKGLGKAAGKLGRAVGGVFDSKEEGEKTSFGQKVLGQSERELAKQFDVDVYTRNPYMRELLTQMARARAGGRGAAFIAGLLIPVAGLASVALTASGVNGTADRLVNDYGKAELYRMNREALEKLKCPAWTVTKLLNSAYYTPREVTYLRTYMEELNDVMGYEDILKKAAEAKGEWEARKILYASQIAADQSLNHKALFTTIRPWQDGLLAKDADSLILILPYDYLQNNQLGKKVVQSAVAEFEKAGKRHLEIWTAGQVNQDFLGVASANNIQLRWKLLWGAKKTDEKV